MKRIYVLHFDQNNYDKPVVYQLIRNFDLVVNILRAVILPRKESYLVLEISGEEELLERGLAFLKNEGVKAETVRKSVRRNEDICISCGACTAICPTGALYIERPSMEVLFAPEKCSACGLCVNVCPPRAMEVNF
ncbi:MAG: 4Fe-4S dicluster domain-containing protein [Deltaproteobacteria bacterium]|nr:4Fe-4S dicluster domain-containing protein [Deltaproteobacteria bacterium]